MMMLVNARHIVVRECTKGGGLGRRMLSSERPGLADTSFASQLNAAEVKKAAQAARTFPNDDGVFTEGPLLFDTHKMVSYLKAGGFSELQSESVTDAMVRVSQHANRHHSTMMVTKNEFVTLRSELSILEKADFALLKTDINAVEKRMETSVAEIYTAIERVENRVIKWVIAVAGAIGLGILRMTTTGGGSSGSGSSSSSPRIGALPPPSNMADNHLPKQLRRDGLQILVT